MSEIDTAGLADLTSHHIEGIARHGNTPFSVPLFSQIDGNLWMGGCPRGSAPEHFQYIVSLYPWEHYAVQAHQVITRAQLFDAEEIPDEGKLRALAVAVNAFRRAGPTLVHCQAGLNRSGLITGLALVLSGAAPLDAISLLRSKRCGAVLCNPSFEGWLMDAAYVSRLRGDLLDEETERELERVVSA